MNPLHYSWNFMDASCEIVYNAFKLQTINDVNDSAQP